MEHAGNAELIRENRHATPKTLRYMRWVSLVGIFAILYHFEFRPWMLDWGASEKIRNLSLPGDSLTGTSRHSRAVLIHASPDKIWPWIKQLGQERGGFYSYTWLENLFAADMHNVYELTPSLQATRATGDTVWLSTRAHYDGQGYQVLALIQPNQSFVMVDGSEYARLRQGNSAHGLWGIYLYPENDQSTWLIARSSSDGSRPAGDKVLRYFIFELPHFIMEQKMLRTIRDLAEK